MILLLVQIFVPFWAEIVAIVVYPEGKICDFIALGQEVFFVERLDIEQGFHGFFSADRAQHTVFQQLTVSTIEVGSTGKNLQGVLLRHCLGIVMEIGTVCLEMDNAAFFQETAVSFQKERPGEAFFSLPI